jgi:hypothetical protein
MHDTSTCRDVHREKAALHRQLLGSYHAIWQRYAREEDAASCAGEAEAAAEAQKARAAWEKRWMRVNDCQTEWVGYYADCCKGFTAPMAVPIGCNDRLCPLCCHHRSERARKRIRTMFDRLTHPALITLTIPNVKTIRKHSYTLFRQRVRRFIAQHKGWIQGGVYSLETTYNRRDKSWHIHVHVLADLATSLPPKTEKAELAGRRVCKFTAIKMRLEFDWLRLWHPAKWGRKVRTDASAMKREGDAYEFNEWARLCHMMRRKEYRGGAWKERTDISAEQLQLCFEWNQQNRMVVDLKPVTDREGAAFEVLKYITKVAAFSDIPEAVEPFCNAVRGARLIQTFGTWYGVKLDEPADAAHVHDWDGFTCTCGQNVWKRLGLFHRKDVEMQPGGRYQLRRPHDWKSSGTIARPTIRALDVREGTPNGLSSLCNAGTEGTGIYQLRTR